MKVGEKISVKKWNEAAGKPAQGRPFSGEVVEVSETTIKVSHPTLGEMSFNAKTGVGRNAAAQGRCIAVATE